MFAQVGVTFHFHICETIPAKKLGEEVQEKIEFLAEDLTRQIA